MKQIVVCILVTLSIFIAAPVYSQLTPNQFNHGITLGTSGNAAFYELELPLEVYKGSLRSDLGDIRLFNAANQVIPHTLKKIPSKQYKPLLRTTSLPFFPLTDKQQHLDENISIQIDRSADGTVIKVNTPPEPTTQHSISHPDSYLIDISNHKERIHSLKLHWTKDAESFLTEVKIERSNDLKIWIPFTSAAIGELGFNSYRFNQDEIQLPRTNDKYLRLYWSNDVPNISLSSIEAISISNNSIKKSAKNLSTFSSITTVDGKYRIDTGGSLQITAINITLPETNSIAAMQLLSSASNKTPMQNRWSGLVYNLTTGDSNLTNPEIAISPLRHQFWELAVLDSVEINSVQPSIKFSWQPDKLIFLAQGDGPYTLTYGNNNIKPGKFSIDAILANTKHEDNLTPHIAIAGKPFNIGNTRPKALTPMQWKTYTLWGVLIIGVLAVGIMSFSLYRKLQNDNRDDSSTKD